MPPKFVRPQIAVLLSILFAGGSAAAQSLMLSSGSALPGGSLSLNVSLNSGTATPAGLQWTLSYPAGVSSMTMTVGPALTAATKTLNCSGRSGAVTCLATGMNTAVIASGVVAVATATLAAGSSGTLAVP